MNWIDDTQNAINFIENNLLENIGAEDVSKHINVSADYFQRTFNIVTGLSISEYIRNRRLTLAGEELKNTRAKVIDLSMKYGYDSPDSFTKAFTRFHGVTPASARISDGDLKHFLPLSIKIFIKGGFGMNRKIIQNIPVINYDGNETDFGVNVLAATFDVTGVKTDKTELAFYSGMANHFCWIEGGWVQSRGQECFGNNGETIFEEELRFLKIMGWSAKYVVVNRDKDGTMLNTDGEQIKRDFVESIDKGYPILLRRVKNNRYSFCIGYENDGDIIIFKEAVDKYDGSDDPKITETSTQENWQNVIRNYIVLKERLEPVSERRRVLEQLEYIIARARKTDKIKGRISSGFAAWEAFLHMLEHEDLSLLPLLEDVPDKDSVQLRLGIYCDGLCQIWGRHAALPYYRSLAEKYPEWSEELNTAVDALDECSKYGGFLWSQGFAFEGEGLEKFRDPAVRKILADEGRKAMQKDMEAIGQFEKILRLEGVL